MSDMLNHLDFATVMASSVHDMKNSLSMLLNTLDDVIDDPELAKSENFSTFLQLQYEAKRVNANLIQMLALYKMENVQYVLNVTEHDVGDFLNECLLSHEILLRHKGIAYEMICQENLFWNYDRELIAGVVNNVINNTYKYTRDKITLSAKIDQNCLVIQIADNGEGYPQHLLHQPNIQGTGVDFQNGSTGLGLYFAALAAQLHGFNNKKGFISISNAGIDGGGLFSIHLP